MIVVDASVVVEVILQTELGQLLTDPLLKAGPLAAPHLLDIEVTQALRRWVLRGDLNPERALTGLADLADLPLRRYPHELLVPRIWQLRENITAYDAAYVALAKGLAAEFWTCDLRLARSAQDWVETRTWSPDAS